MKGQTEVRLYREQGGSSSAIVLYDEKYLTVPTRRDRLGLRRRESRHNSPCLSELRRSLRFLCVRQWRGPFWGPLFFTGLITRSRGFRGGWLRRGERRKVRRPLRLRANGRKKRPWRWRRRGRKPRARRN